MQNKYLEAGKAVNTHGVAGNIKLESWCDTPATLVKLKKLYIKLGEEYTPIKIERAFVQKEWAIIKLEGCNTFEDAIKYKNKILYCDRDDIPMKEGDYFIADILGLPVIDIDDGTVYGKVVYVIKGAGDIYEIERENGEKAYMPAVEEFVKKIDFDNGIYVKPIEGMFE